MRNSRDCSGCAIVPSFVASTAPLRRAQSTKPRGAARISSTLAWATVAISRQPRTSERSAPARLTAESRAPVRSAPRRLALVSDVADRLAPRKQAPSRRAPFESRALEVGLLETGHRQRRQPQIDRLEPGAVEVDAGERDVVAYEVGERVDASARSALALRAVDHLPGLIVRVLPRAPSRFRFSGPKLVAIRPELIRAKAEGRDLEQPDDVDGVLQPLRPDRRRRGGHPREHDGERTEEDGDHGDHDDQPPSAAHAL